jgi:glycosyltransferase involved in cell wall biosynthesis
MEYVLSDPSPEDHCLNIEYVGPVHGRKRSDLIGNARCMLMPTSFIEPFAGSGVESMLCGTPLIAVDYGAFTETIREGVSGYRCNTLGDWMHAIDASKKLDRATVSSVTRERYSLQACGKLYDTAFRQLTELGGTGWYSTESHRVQGAAS